MPNTTVPASTLVPVIAGSPLDVEVVVGSVAELAVPDEEDADDDDADVDEVDDEAEDEDEVEEADDEDEVEEADDEDDVGAAGSTSTRTAVGSPCPPSLSVAAKRRIEGSGVGVGVGHRRVGRAGDDLNGRPVAPVDRVAEIGGQVRRRRVVGADFTVNGTPTVALSAPVTTVAGAVLVTCRSAAADVAAVESSVTCTAIEALRVIGPSSIPNASRSAQLTVGDRPVASVKTPSPLRSHA